MDGREERGTSKADKGRHTLAFMNKGQPERIFLEKPQAISTSPSTWTSPSIAVSLGPTASAIGTDPSPTSASSRRYASSSLSSSSAVFGALRSLGPGPGLAPPAPAGAPPPLRPPRPRVRIGPVPCPELVSGLICGVIYSVVRIF